MNLPLSELINVLSNPEKQTMDILMSACKQAAVFIQGEEEIHKKGAEFAKLFLNRSERVIEKGDSTEIETLVNDSQEQSVRLMNNLGVKTIPGAYNIYIIRNLPLSKSRPAVEVLQAIREASGSTGGAPRMSLQKANELLHDIDLGDRAILIRSVPSKEDAEEIISNLAAVGIAAEIRS